MIRICLETDAANVYLQISDNGSGIPEENLPHIFERSFTRRSGHNGQGLGLFLVKSIVTEHGGTVEVQSAPGKGSTFTVCLPLLTGPADGADV